MIPLPTTCYIVDYETDTVSERTGKKIWREELLTSDKRAAEKCMEELKNKGLNARMYESTIEIRDMTRYNIEGERWS